MQNARKNKSEIYLSKCQVDTPDNVLRLMWALADESRENIGNVVDLGAGDGRFSRYGQYSKYTGFELDVARMPKPYKISDKAIVKNSCAFKARNSYYDICIGNPPYVRHHDIDDKWQRSIISELSRQAKVKIDARANAFTLFMLKAILTTKNDGLICLLVPYEWVSRPSCKWLREFIESAGWSVHVYKFKEKVFSRVLTTSSIVVIDKSIKTKKWRFSWLGEGFSKSPMRLVTGSNNKVLKYTKRTKTTYAQRGLSPGGQKIFCITEGERLHYGLEVGRDVLPCVTSFKEVPENLRLLDKKSFTDYFVNRGRRCWLIRNDLDPSAELKSYLASISTEERNNYTCNNQTPWWNYTAHEASDILYASSFTKWGPKILENKIKAIAVGSVHGVHKVKGIDLLSLIEKIKGINFEKKIVHHSGALKKIEVNQMNTILQKINGS